MALCSYDCMWFMAVYRYGRQQCPLPPLPTDKRLGSVRARACVCTRSPLDGPVGLWPCIGSGDKTDNSDLRLYGPI